LVQVKDARRAPAYSHQTMHTDTAIAASLHAPDPAAAALLGETRERLAASPIRLVDAAPLHLLVCTHAGADGSALVRQLARRGDVIVLQAGEADPWQLFQAGAIDVLPWHGGTGEAEALVARCERVVQVAQLADGEVARRLLVGASPCWRALVRSVVEAAVFSQSEILVTGETGTGKDMVARAIHALAGLPDEMTVVDCTTLTPELAGSELFGHERGAFTGATGPRDGAFAQADGGLLFLDEVGELPLALQAQLLRAIQEHTYKRVGGNTWQRSRFRLVCATNRDLEAEVAAGRFRADLYYRLAAWQIRMPALRERIEDIPALAHHFLLQCGASGASAEMDAALLGCLARRPFPGNVRELRQVVTRAWYRHAGPGPVGLGALAPEDRPCAASAAMPWPDPEFECAIRRAIASGATLGALTQAAGDLAIRLVLEQENHNNQRAAARLGVTDRALQIRRKAWSQAA
jgi:transcriptional regulator with GAF, ATPase, and Fis domain